METKVRRTQDNLFIMGTSVIVFGLWDLIKFTVYFFVNSDEIKQASGEKYFMLSVIVVWTIFFVSFLLRCFIGFSARAEGKGKRKSILYLICAGMIALVYFSIIVFEVSYFITDQENIITAIVTLIIDITSLVFLVELIVNSIKIR